MEETKDSFSFSVFRKAAVTGVMVMDNSANQLYSEKRLSFTHSLVSVPMTHINIRTKS